jgi:integration host factor subunit alpha
MTKNDIVDKIYDTTPNITLKEATTILESIISTIKYTLADGENVKISGFGKWSVRDKNERPGRNPKTGKEIEIEARRVVTFAVSTVLKGEM